MKKSIVPLLLILLLTAVCVFIGITISDSASQANTPQVIDPYIQVNGKNPLKCQETPFCNRNYHLQQEFGERALSTTQNDFYYTLDPASILIDDEKSSVSAILKLACADTSSEISP